MSDLAAFLLARIAEDEAVAVDNVAWRGRLYDGAWQIIDTEDDELVATVEHDHEWSHITRHDPARVLAECAAKRQIVDNATNVHTSGPEWDEALRILAQPYADHPDFREEWQA